MYVCICIYIYIYTHTCVCFLEGTECRAGAKCNGARIAMGIGLQQFEPIPCIAHYPPCEDLDCLSLSLVMFRYFRFLAIPR